MNYRAVFNIIGKVLCVASVFMIPALIISLCLRENAGASGLAVSIVIGAINSVLELLRYAFYLRYLRQCAAMLAAYDGEAEDE